MPSYAQLNQRIAELVYDRDGEWAGFPMPQAGMTLTVEDRSPHKETVAKLQAILDEGDERATREAVEVEATCTEEDLNWVVRNEWWSTRLRATVMIAYNTLTRKTWWRHGQWDYVKKATFLFETMRAAPIWPIDAEFNAQVALSKLIREHLFEAYICTGTFIETSKRSGLTYIFRRCKPTLVYNAQRQVLITALCLHPIGYFQGTHAGSMVPTDDLIAHLLMMRADEHLFWKRANQHPIDRPEAGL